VNYYAHTAKLPDGRQDPDERNWQLLSEHLRNVAQLAKQFAAPLSLSSEAELAGLLHDLGKYAERFQARLRNPAIRGINHWAAGARKAAELKARLVDYAVDGHHTGKPQPSYHAQLLPSQAPRDKTARQRLNPPHTGLSQRFCSVAS
jgi:CRISPR-associated endonuclease/helicase Cas3